MIDKIGINAGNAAPVSKPAGSLKSTTTENNPEIRDRVTLSGDKCGCKKPWTILYYLAGNNNISQDMILKAARLEQAGSNKDVNIAVQMAQPENSPYPGVTRFKIEKNPNKVRIPKVTETRVYRAGSNFKKSELPTLVSPPLEKIDNAAMNDPKVLTDFIAWGMKSYPADHYLVVIMDHGYGFVGTVEDNKQDKVLSLPEIKQALKGAQEETGKKIDILGLDSCLMQQAETAYQFRDHAGYLLASEEVEYPLGMPEGNMAKRLQEELEKGEVTPADAAKILVDEAGKAKDAMKTISAIDLKQMNDIKDKTNTLAKELQKSSLSKTEIEKIIKNTYNYCQVLPNEKLCTDYRDLSHFAKQLIAAEGAGDGLKSAAKELVESIGSAVVAEAHVDGEVGAAGGLSIYLPGNGMLEKYDRQDTGQSFINPRNIYMETDWAKDTQWDEWVQGLKETK
ncbi:MAG: clostripain-related cysteine peptidase [Chloroflexi bacterium]|nr:clostripain-related cysteine peptidase [Chloroflexota bacterium]